MDKSSRLFWCGLCCAALLVGSAGCTRHKPERVRAPFRGVPTAAGGTASVATIPPSEASIMAATAAAIIAAAPTVVPLATTTLPAAAAPTQTPVAPLDAATEMLYEIKSGDTIAAIGERIGVTSAALMQRNGITNPQGLAVGQKLIIPLQPTPTTAATPTAMPPTTAPTAAATFTPAPSATAAPTPTPTPSVVPYVVQPADTLERIARLYLTTVDAILRLNPGIDPLRLVIGSSVLVPVPPAQAPRTHTVQPGETLAGIAARYGLTMQVLMDANNLTNANLIYAGQKLVIP